MKLFKTYVDYLAAIEALAGSTSILLFGFFTIPLAAAMSGATITTTQGIKMSLIFFVGRWLLLYVIRCIFKKKNII